MLKEVTEIRGSAPLLGSTPRFNSSFSVMHTSRFHGKPMSSPCVKRQTNKPTAEKTFPPWRRSKFARRLWTCSSRHAGPCLDRGWCYDTAVPPVTQWKGGAAFALIATLTGNTVLLNFAFAYTQPLGCDDSAVSLRGHRLETGCWEMHTDHRKSCKIKWKPHSGTRVRIMGYQTRAVICACLSGVLQTGESAQTHTHMTKQRSKVRARVCGTRQVHGLHTRVVFICSIS